MTERFLADTSALVRFFRGQTGAQWDQLASSGLLGICEPVRQEHLRAAGGRPAYYEAASLLHEIFPYFSMPDSCWEDAAQLRDRLAEKRWHQCTSPIDLLVAVTASHHKLTVLHADSDFETIGRLTGQPLQRID
ncbi:PIN domain nuclease [Nocardia salmonicida]|uniref:PIN domain nuclease n=1 Tax=Nocardia salmonicida TaxID=53431 RepID=UPI0007A45833|nr:PIN domain nuclease [Nocardia salmonicida]